MSLANACAAAACCCPQLPGLLPAMQQVCPCSPSPGRAPTRPAGSLAGCPPPWLPLPWPALACCCQAPGPTGQQAWPGLATIPGHSWVAATWAAAAPRQACAGVCVGVKVLLPSAAACPLAVGAAAPAAGSNAHGCGMLLAVCGQGGGQACKTWRALVSDKAAPAQDRPSTLLVLYQGQP